MQAEAHSSKPEISTDDKADEAVVVEPEDYVSDFSSNTLILSISATAFLIIVVGCTIFYLTV